MNFPRFPSRPFSSWWPFGTLGIIVFVMALAAFFSYQNRLHYEQQARVSAENLSQVLGGHISSATEKIDLVLKAAALEMLQQRARKNFDTEALQLFLVQQKLLLSDVGDLLVADDQGIVRYGTDVSPESNIEISDREYFRRLREQPHPGLVISGPVRSRVDGRWAMIFARQVNHPDGTFAGAVLAIVHADRFRDMLSLPDLGPGGVVALQTQEMELVARVPVFQEREMIGTRIVPPAFKASLQANPLQGAFTAVSSLDNTERSFVYRKLPGLPFYVVVGSAVQDYLATWRKETFQLGGLVGFFALISLALSWAARRAVERQQAASQELARHRDQLERLVDERTAELRESVAHFRATFEQAGVGVCHADLEGRFLRVNDKFCAIVGYGRGELLNLDFQSVSHPEDVQANLEGRQRLLAGTAKSYSMEKRYVRKDGTPIWVNLTVDLVRNAAGEPDYFLAVIEDIQERKEMAIALAEEREARHRILEEQVAERTAELQVANVQLEGFLYAASHDLKGPLGRISSFSSLLEKNYRDRLEGEGLLFLDFIRENALRLTLLVDDLLNHARIDQQMIQLQPTLLPEAIAASLREKAEDIREKGAVVRVENLPPATVLADCYGLKQVLNNLLENALKYSSTGITPEIRIGGERRDGRFRLWVRDNGIGFDMAYQDRIFEIFRRLHTYSEYAGSGVGLALVKRAMERMGGKVWAESAPGQGATFFLEFQTVVRDTVDGQSLPVPCDFEI